MEPVSCPHPRTARGDLDDREYHYRDRPTARAHSLPLAADRSVMMVLFRNVTVQLAAMDNNAAVR